MNDFDWSVLGAPLIAGLLVTATHVVLGRRVLERGIIFIDLSIAQVAALGAVIAGVYGWSGESVAAHAAALGAALGAAGLLAWTERRWPQIQEALIGCMYVVAASVALLALVGNWHDRDMAARQLAADLRAQDFGARALREGDAVLRAWKNTERAMWDQVIADLASV